MLSAQHGQEIIDLINLRAERSMNDMAEKNLTNDAMPTDAIETSDAKVMGKTPLVTVLMITYNHAPYLSDAIHGVIMQKCDFPFELIIGEDCSTDATRKIALEYQKKYPDIIRVIHSSRNVGMSRNSRRIFDLARGKYVAYCEGDDFWCDPEKLAKQVAMMEANPEIGIVHTDWVRSRLIDQEWRHDFKRSVHSRVANKYLQGNLYSCWHFPKILRTCTYLVRRETMAQWYASGLLDNRYPFGDAVLSSWITSRFMVGYIPAVTAVYRVSPNSALRSGAAARIAFYKYSLEFDTAARRFFAGTGYGDGYRWDSAASLMVWGLRARDFHAVKHGILDFCKHFTLPNFLATGIKNVIMRLPTLKRQRRWVPASTSQCQRK